MAWKVALWLKVLRPRRGRGAGSAPPRNEEGPRWSLIASVVVPTYNRCDRLRRVLGALADQTLPRDSFEVIVVSDGSTDGTDEYLRGGQTPVDVVAVTQPNSGPGPARNAGVERARGDLVVFVDDDVVAEPDLVEQHVRSHEHDDGRLVVIGPMLTPGGLHAEPRGSNGSRTSWSSSTRR